MASSRESHLEIQNKTRLTMTIRVDGTDNFDWDGDSRPDHNFNNVSIGPNSSKREREELNANASSAWFNMYITFDNGDQLTFRNDQYDAFDNYRRFYNADGSSKENYLLCQTTSGSGENTFLVFPFSVKDWMKTVSDDVSLLNLSIPGTHDSCALDNSYSFGYAKCQDWKIEAQLAHGVRYLDIRGEAIKADTGDYITIKHGVIQQPYDFNQVLKETIEFLNGNPTEFVLLQLKQESSDWDKKDYANLVSSYINNENYNPYFHLDQYNLKLGDVRGKIVLVNRFYNSPDYGINVSDWSDNDCFSKNQGVIAYNVQDVYQTSETTYENARDKKMEYINKFFKDYAYKRDQLNLCFCSATAKWPPFATPKEFATGDDGINERTSQQHLQSKTGWNGVTLFDFVDSEVSVTIPYVINNNFTS